MTRRILAGVAAAAVLAAGLTALGNVQPASACACGAPTPPDGMRVSVGEEHGLVTFDGVTERIDLVLDMLADGADTGLVLPTPSPATVSLGDPALFDALDRQTVPVVETRQDWWSLPGGDGVGAPAGGAPVVLSEVDLGPVHAVTLAASDTEGLRVWLDENGYGIAPAVQELLGDYVDRGWSFAALRLTGDAPLDGALDPVRFEFATGAPVYPLLLSRAAETPQTVRLYLFGDDRIEPAFAGSDTAVNGSVTWAGAVTEPELTGLGSYLTVYEAYFSDPARQIVGDLELVSTGAREDYAPVVVRTEHVELGGIPLGILLVGAGVLLVALLALAVALVAVARARRG